MAEDLRGILIFLALLLGGCAPSEGLETYTTTVKPKVSAELDTVTNAGVDKLCNMNVSRTGRLIGERGDRFGMGMGLICEEAKGWREINRSMTSAATVSSPKQEK